MPIYEYQCLGCPAQDKRVAGLDDHTAFCIQCGGVMLRQDEDLLHPYFDNNKGTQTCAQPSH
ncbi:MAG: FmdB family zinc ribbon protein [Desulfobaccales bacterium]